MHSIVTITFASSVKNIVDNYAKTGIGPYNQTVTQPSSQIANYEKIIIIGSTVAPGNVVLEKDVIYELFTNGATNIPNIVDVGFSTVADGTITKADTDKLTIVNHNVVSSVFINTNISDKLIFFSNDVSANSILFQANKVYYDNSKYNFNFAIQLYRMLVTTDYATFGTNFDVTRYNTRYNIENQIFFNDTDASANTLNYQVKEFYKLFSINFAVQILMLSVVCIQCLEIQ